MDKTRLAITGVSGRMGRSLIQAIQQSEDIVLGAAFTKNNSLINRDLSDLIGTKNTGIIITDNLLSAVNNFDILVDFSHPESSLMYLHFCRQHKKSIVIGTTGFNEIGQKTIRVASKEIGIVFSSNFSVGINIMLSLLYQVAKVIGNYTDIEIIEAHHRHKIDAPSGTALAMGLSIANAMGWNLNEHMYLPHKEHIGKRKKHTIGFSSIRAGNIIGEHTAMFVDEGERIELIHKASSRMIFANGAIKAANWLKDKDPGFYNMCNVLNL